MKTREDNIRWGLAFVRKSLLPEEGTWTEVPYYTYEIDGNRNTWYKAQCKDFPIELKAIESYPILESFVSCNYEIKPDQSVFIDWRGNYFIGKEECFDLQPENITVIHKSDSIFDESTETQEQVFLGIKTLDEIKKRVKHLQAKICDEQQYCRAVS